jgi:hypothetical protein
MQTAFQMLVAIFVVCVVQQTCAAEEVNQNSNNYTVRCRVIEDTPVLRILGETTWNAIRSNHYLLVNQYNDSRKIAAKKSNQGWKFNGLIAIKEKELKHIVVGATQRPFVTAVKQRRSKELVKYNEPVIQIIDEGMFIDFKLSNASAGLLTLDTSIELTEITGVDEKTVEEDLTLQVPNVETSKIRKVETVKLSETISIPVKAGETKRRLLMQVTKVN